MKRILILIGCLLAVVAGAQTRLTINTGTAANDGSGDSLRAAFGKVNTNTATLWAAVFTNGVPSVSTSVFDTNWFSAASATSVTIRTNVYLTNDFQIQGGQSGAVNYGLRLYPLHDFYAGATNLTITSYSAASLDAPDLTIWGHSNLYVISPGVHAASATTGHVLTLTDGETGKVEFGSIGDYTGTVSVKEYGATGDGSTDDTSAINAAISVANSSGKPVVFPKGTYKVVGASLSTANVLFKFEGGAIANVITSTWTVNGSFSAHPRQIISSSLSTPVTFNRGAGGYLGPATGIGLDTVWAEWFGAKGDASTDNATALGQWMRSLGNGMKAQLAGGNYYVSSQLSFPANRKFNVFDGNGSRITYSGSTDSSKAVLAFTVSTIAGYRCTFKNITFDANNAAGYCLNAVSPGGSFSLSSFTFDGCQFVNATAVNTRIGNYTSSSNDIDLANCIFNNCLWMGGTGANNIEIDAPNAVSVAFRSCSIGYVSTSSLPTYNLRLLNGATATLDTCFLDRVAVPGYSVYNSGFLLSINGCDSEDCHFLWQESTYNKQNLATSIRGLRLSDAGSRAADGDYCIYAVAGTLSIEGSILQASAKKFRVRCDSKLSMRDTWLGGTLGSSPTRAQGADLVLASPAICDLDGWNVGNSKAFFLNGNPYFSMWNGSASGDLPVGYKASSVGSFTIQQAGTSSGDYPKNNFGRYAAKVSVSSGAVSGGVIDGILCRVRVDNRRGPGPYVVMVSGYAESLSGATAPAVTINSYTWNGAAWSVANAQIRTCDIDASGRFWGVATIDKAPSSIQSGYIDAYCGMGVNGASGTIYLSEMVVLRSDGITWLDSSQGTYPDYGRLKTLSVSPKPAQLNGSFANGSAWWTVGSGWTVSGGIATHTTSGGTAALSQDVGFAMKTRRCLVTFTVSGRTAGSITPVIGGASGTAISANGQSIQEIISGSSDQLLSFAPTTDFDGSVTGIILYMVRQGGEGVTGDDWAKAGQPGMADQGVDVVAGDLNLNPIRQTTGSAAPTVGTWKKGDIVWNSAPASSSPAFWICSVSGTPGTWKAGPNVP